MNNLLVVVHPASLCGSADFNMGLDEAFDARLSVIMEIREWNGPIAVISGDFHDELAKSRYSDLRSALERAQYTTRGEPEERSLEEAARRVVSATQSKPISCRITVTGAWHDNDGSGCVTSVANSLKSDGFEVIISPNAPASD